MCSGFLAGQFRRRSIIISSSRSVPKCDANVKQYIALLTPDSVFGGGEEKDFSIILFFCAVSFLMAFSDSFRVRHAWEEMEAVVKKQE